MTTHTTLFVQTLAEVLNDNATARWNYPLAVGSSLDAPAGLGRPVSVTYTFLQSPPSYYPSGDRVFDQFQALSAAKVEATRAVLAQFSAVANIRFTETTTGVGQITLGSHAMSTTGSLTEEGYAYLPNFAYVFNPETRAITSVREDQTGGDIWINRDITDANVQPGMPGYGTLLHEVGHAVGLKHPFEGTYRLSSLESNTRYTVMSYTSPENMRTTEVSGDASDYRWITRTVEPRSLMPVDILALQYLYGANTATRAGDDTYRWAPGERFLETIWDGGGNDTIDASNQTLDCVIDLNEGRFSSIGIRSTSAQLRQEIPSFAAQATTPTYDGRDNLGIAYNVVIENAIGGSGNDRLVGNSANNRLTGGPGNDSLDGGAGIDTAVFGAARSSYRVTRNSDGTIAVTDQRSGSPEGTDALANIERLRFSDTGLAFDLDGSAGNAARIIGAAFGLSYLQPALVGVGIQVFDLGLTMQQVAEAALGIDLFRQVAGSRSNEAVVRTLYTNVVGTAPPASDLQTFVRLLEGGTSQADLLVLAANTDLNAQRINLVGLASSGLEYA